MTPILRILSRLSCAFGDYVDRLAVGRECRIAQHKAIHGGRPEQYEHAIQLLAKREAYLSANGIDVGRGIVRRMRLQLERIIDKTPERK